MLQEKIDSREGHRPDLDPTPWGKNWIRIQAFSNYGSGSATLLEYYMGLHPPVMAFCIDVKSSFSTQRLSTSEFSLEM